MVALTLARNTPDVMNRLGLTKKQYYLRMNRLINAGLVMKKSSKYFLTSFGKVVYESHMLLGKAVENYWKLKAIDSIEMSSTNHELSAQERSRIIDTLIQSDDIKEMLFAHNSNNIASAKRERIQISENLLFPA